MAVAMDTARGRTTSHARVVNDIVEVHPVPEVRVPLMPRPFC